MAIIYILAMGYFAPQRNLKKHAPVDAFLLYFALK